MKHVLLIDDLEKLNIKKDSSLYIARTLKEKGEKVYLCFKENIFFYSGKNTLDVFEFSLVAQDDYYLTSCELGNKQCLSFNEIYLHMRLDPPFNMEYLQILWFLELYENMEMKVTNKASSIMKYSEKMMVETSQLPIISSFYGTNLKAFEAQLERWKKQGFDEIIVKPINLYSGIGVEKWNIEKPSILSDYEKKSYEYGSSIMAQPFIKEVYKGEQRSLFFRGEHLGTITKKAAPGSFLSNIAQGASFEASDLVANVFESLASLSLSLYKEGIDFIAVDILDNKVTEVNLTCPGLINEVSKAHGQNVFAQVSY